MKNLLAELKAINKHYLRNYKLQVVGERKYDQDFKNYQSEGIGSRIKRSIRKGK